MVDKNDEPRTIEAVGKACRIIDKLHDDGGARVTDIANHLDINKGTAHTHLTTLKENGFVTKDGKQYQPSLKFLNIGEGVKTDLDIFQSSKSVIEDLADKTDTRTHIVTTESGLVVTLAIGRGKHAIAPPSRPGKKDHMHCTASGKAILAHLPRDRVESILDQHGLPKHTQHTITDRETLFEELSEVESRGIAFNDEERVEGLQGIGTPIFDSDGSVLGALSATRPNRGLNNDQFSSQTIEAVHDGANTIEFSIRAESNELEAANFDSI